MHLQTQQKVEMGAFSMGVKVVRNEGALGLYNGLSASVLRQVRLMKLLLFGMGRCGGWGRGERSDYEKADTFYS